MTDISKNVQTLIKKAYHVPSTYHNTKWWNEKGGKYQTIIEGEDINVQTPPETPIWSTDASMTESELSNLDMSMVTATSFSSQDCSFVETYVESDSDYSMNFGMSPGAYLDSTGTVALFVRLKLDKMITDYENDKYGVDTSAFAYVKYPTDSSLNSILSNAYQFNYNTQLDVSSTIQFFQPYRYTLEYSDDDTTFTQLTNNNSSWNFDFKSGIITFENNPTDVVDLGDSNVVLYFTFVKYVGLRGVNNLDTINGDLTVGGTADISSNLTVGGDIQFDGSDTYQNIWRYGRLRIGYNSSSSDPGNGLDTSAMSYIDFDEDHLLVGGEKTILRHSTVTQGSAGTGQTGLTVSSSGTDITSNLSVGGDLSVDGSANISSKLTVGGTADINSNLTVGGTADASSVTITNDLTVGGDIQFNGGDAKQNIWRNGILRIGHNSSSSDPGDGLADTGYSWASFEEDALYLGGDTVQINYGSSASSSGFAGLTVSSTGTDITGDLSVGGTADINSNLTVGGTADISSNLTVGGDIHFDGTDAFIKSISDNSGVIITCDTSNYGGSDNFGGILGFGYRDDNYPGLHNRIVSYQSSDNWKMDFYIRNTKAMGFMNNAGTTSEVDICYNANIAGNLTVGGAVTDVNWCDEANAKLKIAGDTYMDGGLTFGQESGADSYGIKCQDGFIIGRTGSNTTVAPTEENSYAYLYMDMNTVNIAALSNVNICTGTNANDYTVNGTIGLTVNSSGTDISGDLTVGGFTNISTDSGSGSAVLTVARSSSSLKSLDLTGYVEVNGWLDIAGAIFAYGGSDSTINKLIITDQFGVDGTSTFSSTATFSGNVGIGITPTYPLHINNTTNSGSTGFYIDSNNNRLYEPGEVSDKSSRVNTDANVALSIYSVGGIGLNGGKYYNLSDERIKTNIRDISDDEALVTFRKLQPKIYNYKDTLKSGYNSVYGFIAQEVEEVIPNSTGKDTCFIPNIYSICEIDNSSNMLTFHFGASGETIEQFDLSINDIIQIEDVSKNMIERTIINIIDETRIQVNDEYIPAHTHDSSGIELSYNQVFVYGKRVDDCYRLDKNSIWTVAAAALQEVDRQLVAEKEKTATLETEVATLKTQISTFETQITELLARVSSLETTTDGS